MEEVECLLVHRSGSQAVVFEHQKSSLGCLRQKYQMYSTRRLYKVASNAFRVAEGDGGKEDEPQTGQVRN